jgi:hypothetical protein
VGQKYGNCGAESTKYGPKTRVKGPKEAEKSGMFYTLSLFFAAIMNTLDKPMEGKYQTQKGPKKP